MAKCIPRHVKPNSQIYTAMFVAAPFVLMHANAAFYKGLLHNARLLCVKQRYLHTGIECEIITHRAGSQSYLQRAIYAHSHMCWVLGLLCHAYREIGEQARRQNCRCRNSHIPYADTRATVGIIRPRGSRRVVCRKKPCVK
jgi:hypothetical protein